MGDNKVESADNKKSYKDQDQLLNWSKEDRFKLLTALRTFHSSNVEDIAREFEDKTFDEVQQALEWYRSKAMRTLKYSADRVYRRINRKRKGEKIPLVDWSSLLQKTFKHEELCTETATACRLLAEFESVPDATKTYADFTKIRLYIANALEGRDLPDLDEFTQYVIDKCVIESAIRSKGFISKPVVRGILMTPKERHHNLKMELSKNPVDRYPINLHYLAVQQAYNPLNIPEIYLKPTEEKEDFPINLNY